MCVCLSAKLAGAENNVLKPLRAAVFLQKAFPSGNPKVADAKRRVVGSLWVDGAAPGAIISPLHAGNDHDRRGAPRTAWK